MKLVGTCEPFKAGAPIVPKEEVVMLVIGATGCLAWMMTAEQVAMQLAEWVKGEASIAVPPDLPKGGSLCLTDSLLA